MARGSVYRRGAGWSYRVDLPRRSGGPRRQVQKGGFRTRAEAEAALVDAISKATGRYTDGRPLTVSDFATRWLDAVRTEVEDKTWQGYETQVRLRIVPELGDRKMRDVTPLDLRELYATVADRPRTARYVHQTVSRMWSDALEWGVVAANPARSVKAPTYQADEKVSWGAGELARFIQAVGGRRDAPLWWVMAMTGLRRGELLGLRWGDVDLDDGTVRVSRAVKRVGVGATKTGDRRTVALDAHTVGVLREWRVTVAGDALRNGWPLERSTPLWVWETGEAFKRDWLTHTFPRLVPDGVPAITLHGFRHLHVTLGARAGVHPRVMKDRVGHRDIRQTMQVYTHVGESDDRDAAEAIARLVLDA